jgi:RNA polymerase sigma-70 factor (ECF subfamily)
MRLDANRFDGRALDALVVDTRAGDERAFALLVQHMYGRVFRWALAYAGDSDEAEDIAQETFVIVLRSIGQFRTPESFHVWLYQIMRRAAIRLQRKQKRRDVLLGVARARPEREVYETDPGGRVHREQLATAVRRFWNELPERQRTVMDLVDLQGYEPMEAAKMLDMNHATLRANLFKARRSVRARLLEAFGASAMRSENR